MNRDRMVRRAVARWLKSTLEASKGSNIDIVDLRSKFTTHSNNQLAGMRLSEGEILSILETEFPGTNFDPKTDRVHGIHWKKVKPVVFKSRPEKSHEDSAMETRMLAFLNDGSVFIKRGEKGFTTTGFANWRQSWFYGGYFHVKHDKIDFDEAQSWLESREDLVRYDEDSRSWFVVSRR